MPATYEIIDVQQVAGGVPTSIQAPAFAANPADGDLILVAQATYGGTTHEAPTDTTGVNTYVQIGPQIHAYEGAGSEYHSLSMWACVNAAGGSTFRVTAHTAPAAYFGVVTWCVRPSEPIAYNGDVASAISVSNANDLDPVTSPAPPSEAFFFCIALRPSNNDALTEPTGWNTTGVNGFGGGKKAAAKYGNYSANQACYSEYQIAATALMGAWVDYDGTSLRGVIVASFSPAAVEEPPSVVGGQIWMGDSGGDLWID